MRILMPFWYLDAFDRYLPEMKSISERIEKFYVVYVDGEVQQEWKEHFEFIKGDMPYDFVRSKMAGFFSSRRSLYSQVKNFDVNLFYTLNGLCGQEFSRYCSSKIGVPYSVRGRVIIEK